ncbi:MAG: type II toxin-antitoxin system HicB family antitoxin [Syntrophorhabdus sp.]
MKFKVILRPDVEDGGFNVSCPALSGCHSQGETTEEAITNIKEAIEGCLEVLNERAHACGQGEQMLEVAVG